MHNMVTIVDNTILYATNSNLLRELKCSYQKKKKKAQELHSVNSRITKCFRNLKKLL